MAKLVAFLHRAKLQDNGVARDRPGRVRVLYLSTVLQTLAVTNVNDLAREVDATQHALHSKKPLIAKVPTFKSQTTRYPTLDELDEILVELHDLYERSDRCVLSLLEQKYTALLTQLAVNALTRAYLACNCKNLDASGVHFKLLEVVQRHSAQWRRLAFTLFFDTSVAVLATLLSTQEHSVTTQAQYLETELFSLLREMMAKTVVISTTAHSVPINSLSFDWVDQAVGCLIFFVKKANGTYRADRLRLLDKHTLLFFVAEASNRDSTALNLQLTAMELVVATLYAFQYTATHKSIGLENQVPTKDYALWTCGLPVAMVEHYVSLEVLLYFFYTSPVARLKRLTCFVLVNCVCDDLRRFESREIMSVAKFDEIWHTLVNWVDLTGKMRLNLLSPYISSARIASEMTFSCPSVSEKLLIAFVTQFRLIVQVDAYFGANPSLETALKGTRNLGNRDEVIDYILKLLQSNRAVERLRGERWLAELLSYNQGNDTFSSYDRKAAPTAEAIELQSKRRLLRRKPALAGEMLKETVCYDEGGDIGAAAQSTFWELASPTNPVGLRTSFANVLTYFIQRKLQLCSGKPDAAIIAEVNTCLHVLLDHRESEAAVLVSVVLLLLDMCQCDLSDIDKRWKERDANNQSECRLDCVARSDSLACLVLNGEVALDRRLLRQLDTAFFLHVLTVLHETSPTHQGVECRRICCGVDDSLVGDVTACTAFIVLHTFSTNSTETDKVETLAALTPLLQACDTRIAIFMAKLVSGLMKRSNEAQYAAFLRELYVACMEADNEKALYIPYLHTQTMLRFYDENV